MEKNNDFSIQIDQNQLRDLKDPFNSNVEVFELTVETINDAIQGYMDDCPNGYWLKLYYFWNDLDTTIFDPLDPLEIEESTQLNLFIKLDQLKTELNKSLKLLENLKSNSEKSQFQLDEQLAITEKYLNFTKALLLFTSLLCIIQIFYIFSVFQ